MLAAERASRNGGPDPYCARCGRDSSPLGATPRRAARKSGGGLLLAERCRAPKRTQRRRACSLAPSALLGFPADPTSPLAYPSADETRRHKSHCSYYNSQDHNALPRQHPIGNANDKGDPKELRSIQTKQSTLWLILGSDFVTWAKVDIAPATQGRPIDGSDANHHRFLILLDPGSAHKLRSIIIAKLNLQLFASAPVLL